MIFIALGSSIGNAEEIFNSAEKYLQNNGIEILKKSGIFKNPPQGGVAKNEFSNAVWEISFLGAPFALLEILKRAEINAGRDVFAEKWADRTLDLDILMFHEQVILNEKLIIPHPKINQRIFVLAPWAEIAEKNLKIPKFGKLEELLKLHQKNTRI